MDDLERSRQSNEADFLAQRRHSPGQVFGKLSYYFACLTPLVLLMAGAMATPRPLYDHSMSKWEMLYCSCLVAALILGALSRFRLVSLRKSNYGAAGMILGLLEIVFLPIVMPVFLQGNPSYNPCLSNVKQLGQGVLMYANDYDEQLPQMSRWNEATYPYLKNQEVYRCPYEEERDLPSYALNRQIQGVAISRANPAAVLLFDSVPGRNQRGLSELFPVPSRHSNHKQTIGFLDGHAKEFLPADTSSLLWNPLVQTKDKEH